MPDGHEDSLERYCKNDVWGTLKVLKDEGHGLDVLDGYRQDLMHRGWLLLGLDDGSNDHPSVQIARWLAQKEPVAERIEP